MLKFLSSMLCTVDPDITVKSLHRQLNEFFNSHTLYLSIVFQKSFKIKRDVPSSWCAMNIMNKMPNSPHNNGLASIGTRRMHYQNGLFALVISRNLALALFTLVLSSWIPSPNLPWGRNISPLPRFNQTL
jgi:hypothetical protein